MIKDAYWAFWKYIRYRYFGYNKYILNSVSKENFMTA